MNDRRQLERIPTNDYYLVYNRDDNNLIGRVMDLNAEGVMLACSDNIQPGEKFKAKLVLPRMIDRYRHIEFNLESRWSRKNLQMGWHETGFRLTGLSLETYSVVEQLMQEITANQRGY